MSPANLLFLCVAVLLPLVPAYLLYRLLPSESDVEGPWQGLKIKLSGAFGGYFLLLITILAFSKTMPAYDVWTVRGHIEFSDGAGTFSEHTLRFVLQPPDRAVRPEGAFHLRLFRVPAPSGVSELPTLIVEHPGYIPVGVDLNQRGEKSTWRRQVMLTDTLVLRPEPPGDPHVH